MVGLLLFHGRSVGRPSSSLALAQGRVLAEASFFSMAGDLAEIADFLDPWGSPDSLGLSGR